MINDSPIATRPDGTPVYDNAPTVVCLLALTGSPSDVRVLVVRRRDDPGAGMLAFPGGYHMRGETWREAGVRELREETGYTCDPAALQSYSYETDEYGNNLVIAVGRATKLLDFTDGEAFEVLELPHPGAASDWAFPRHYRAFSQLLLDLFELQNVAVG